MRLIIFKHMLPPYLSSLVFLLSHDCWEKLDKSQRTCCNNSRYLNGWMMDILTGVTIFHYLKNYDVVKANVCSHTSPLFKVVYKIKWLK